MTNDGEATAVGVACELAVTGAGALALLSAPSPADVPAGSARTFTWSFQASALGDVALALQGAGVDGGTGAEVPVPAASAPLSIVRPAALAVQILSAPALVNVAQGFDVTIRVENTGDSDAAAASVSLALPDAVPGLHDRDGRHDPRRDVAGRDVLVHRGRARRHVHLRRASGDRRDRRKRAHRVDVGGPPRSSSRRRSPRRSRIPPRWRSATSPRP